MPKKSAPEEPQPHLQQIYLYFRSNMVGQIIKTHNLEEFLTVRCC